MRLRRISARLLGARARLSDESGMALMMALGITLVLTIALTTVITFTAAGARDSHRVNAGQKATALAEGGVNNALAVLTKNYENGGLVVYPGDPNLLPSRTTTYPSGDVTWSGVIEAAPVTASWEDQWRITAVGTVPNPTGPAAAPVTRTTTAIVPIVIPPTVSVNPTTSSLNWIYAFNDVTFGESVTVRAPVYANRDLILEQTATIGETIPASTTLPARKNKVAVGRDAWLVNPHNQIGRVLSPPGNLEEVYIQGMCASKNNSTPHSPCLWAGDEIHTDLEGTVIPTGYITMPKLTCCAPYGVPLSSTPDELPVSVMGFWYRNASIGPNSLCQTSSGTPPRFDRPTGADGPDGLINQSATAARPAFDLTGAPYSCTTDQGELSWNGSKLTINGSIFIDGSATSSANDAEYVGRGALILSGTFSMDNHDKLCVKHQGSGCDITAPWDPNVAGMFIFAAGDFATELSTQAGTAGNGIEIKKGEYQGGLFAGKNIDASVTGTVVQGPMVSAYGNVATGQGGELSFPAISFPTSGSAGFTGPLPKPKLLAPRMFGGG